MAEQSLIIPAAHRAAGLRLHRAGPPDAPVILFSHGDGLAPADYAPLLNGWADQGFCILAPEHTPSAAIALWHARVLDMHAAAATIPTSQLHVAGHSFGGHTAAILLGARPQTAGPDTGDLALHQAQSGVLLAPPGHGDDLTPEWQARAPYIAMDWSGLIKPVLFVVGEDDSTAMTHRDWHWRTDGFFACPAQGKRLITQPGADHYLGGIATGKGRPNHRALTHTITQSALFLSVFQK